MRMLMRVSFPVEPFNTPNSSRVPALAEPWFLLFNASVELSIAMTPEDLKASDLDRVGAKYRS